MEGTQRMAGSMPNLTDDPESPLRIDKGAILFAPPGGWKKEVSQARGLGGRIHVLHDEELDPSEQSAEAILTDPRVGAVRAYDPYSADGSRFDAVDDLVVSPGVIRRDSVRMEREDFSDLATMAGILEVAASEE